LQEKRCLVLSASPSSKHKTRLNSFWPKPIFKSFLFADCPSCEDFQRIASDVDKIKQLGTMVQQLRDSNLRLSATVKKF